jgi:hypothetical protein
VAYRPRYRGLQATPPWPTGPAYGAPIMLSARAVFASFRNRCRSFLLGTRASKLALSGASLATIGPVILVNASSKACRRIMRMQARRAMNDLKRYRGYLSPHVERIQAMHLAGADTSTIAEELYQRGVRAQTTNPYCPKMRRIHHVTNLRSMSLHVLQRLGLRTRRRRTQRWPRS